MALATSIALYALSFYVRGAAAFPPPLAPSLGARPWGIFSHVLFGPIALVCGALNFRHGLRVRRPLVHRRIGKTYVVAALATGIIGTYMSAYSYGGLVTHLGFAGLGISTFAATLIAFQHARARRWVQHRAWMVRSYALIFAAVTLRVELPLLAMAFQGFDPAYAIVSWLCWVPNLAVAEMIVRRTTAPLLPRAG